MAFVKVLVFACIFSTCVNKDPTYYTASKVFCESFNARMKQEYHLQSLGWGGVFDNGVNGLYIDYEICMQPDEKSSTQLLEKVMHDLVRAMNRDTQLRASLNQHPISQDNISISIAFVNESKEIVKPLSQIDFHDQKICFSTFDAKTHEYKVYKDMQKPS